MPQVSDGPKELNALLEEVYSSCMRKKNNAKVCSQSAWAAAEGAGWHKNKKGKWIRKSEEEMQEDEIKKDELAKKAGIRRNRKGAGRMGGNRAGAGPGGNCVCPKCGAKVAHQVGTPCYSLDCPKCGTKMQRE